LFKSMVVFDTDVIKVGNAFKVVPLKPEAYYSIPKNPFICLIGHVSPIALSVLFLNSRADVDSLTISIQEVTGSDPSYALYPMKAECHVN
jgi:hypothetical protein